MSIMHKSILCVLIFCKRTTGHRSILAAIVLCSGRNQSRNPALCHTHAWFHSTSEFVICPRFDLLQVNCWLSSPTTSTTDTTSAWRTWCTIWPQRTGPKPKTSSTHGSSRSYSPSREWSPTPCLARWARCPNRLTTSASCTPLLSTKVTVPLTPSTNRVRQVTSPGTARPAARASRIQRCLSPRTHSSTVDICHRCRDSITTISTSSVTRTQTRSVCTVRNMPCKYLCHVFVFLSLFI